MTPHNKDAESAVLGIALQYPERIPTIMAEFREPERAFFVPAHKIIWRGIQDLSDDGREADLLTLTAKLTEMEKLSVAGGPQKLADIAVDPVSPAMLPDYLRIVSEAAQRRRIIEDCEYAVRCAHDESEEISAITGQLDQLALGLMAKESPPEGSEWRAVQARTIELIQERHSTGGKIPGLATGFPEIDEYTGGMKPGELWVLAARPGVGKSAAAMQIAAHVAASGSGVAFFSAEMMAEELCIRALSSLSGLDGLALARGELQKVDFERLLIAARKSKGWPMWIDDRPNMRLTDIRISMRRLVRDRDVKLAVVDYLQLLEEESASRNREDAVRRISNGLKNLAKSLQIPILALAQLSRDSDKRTDKKPRLSDLRDSGSIEQDANVVILMSKPHEQEDRDSDTQTVLFDVAKCRGGKTGDFECEFHRKTTTFILSKNQ